MTPRQLAQKRAADRRYREKNRERIAAYLKAWRAGRTPEQRAADKLAQRERNVRGSRLRRLKDSLAKEARWRRQMHAINRAIRRWKTPEQLEAA